MERGNANEPDGSKFDLRFDSSEPLTEVAFVSLELETSEADLWTRLAAISSFVPVDSI